jgi:ElaB/YqjD/DUF883 family membrane-anchored ribosome-binding protein
MSRIPEQGSEHSSPGVGQIKEKASEIGKNLRDLGSTARDAAQGEYDNLKNQAGEYYEQGRQQAVQWENQVESYVHDKPIQSLLIAAGVGLILGVLWKRS